MKRFLRCSAVVLTAAVLVTGCKKKEEDVSDEAESTLPASEQVAKAPQDEPAVPSTDALPGTPVTDKPMADAPVAPADAPVADVPVPAPTAAADGANFEEWFKKHNLDLNDPKMLDSDPDGDGASNRDEFLADTNPHDVASRPGMHKAIRLKEFSEVVLPLVVEEVSGDKAKIRHTGGAGKTETVKAGDTVHGLPLKVDRVEQIRDTDKAGNPQDRSMVTLEDTGTKEKLTLVKDMPARTAASFAVLTSPDGSANVKVHQGETFKWPGDESATYKVIDLREDQVVLQQLENKQMWTVIRVDAGKTPAPAPAPAP